MLSKFVLPLLQLAWAVWDFEKMLWTFVVKCLRHSQENGCETYNFEKFVTFFFFHHCPSCISSQILSEHPENPSPSLPANRSRLTCHDFHSETLKKQELQPLTLTCPGTSELIEISLFAWWSLKKLIVSVNSSCCLQSLWLFVRDSWSPRKKQTEVK